MTSDYDGAISDLSKALKDNVHFVVSTDRAFAYDQRGLAFVGKGDSDRAIADFKQAIVVDPKVPVVFEHLGASTNARADGRPPSSSTIRRSNSNHD